MNLRWNWYWMRNAPAHGPLLVESLWCRLLHKPIPYPLASWGQWHYSHCDQCGKHRWSWWDRITGWLLGYEFGREPGVKYG